MFFEECKYVVKEKNFHTYIIDDVQISPDFDEENLLEKILIMKKILMRKKVLMKEIK